MSRNVTEFPGTPSAGLDALFAAARAAEPPVPAALLARIEADAAAEIARHAAARIVTFPGPRRRADPLEPLGGWRAVAALAACAVAGFWLGFAGPDSLLALPGLDRLAIPDDLVAFRVIGAEEALGAGAGQPET